MRAAAPHARKHPLQREAHDAGYLNEEVVADEGHRADDDPAASAVDVGADGAQEEQRQGREIEGEEEHDPRDREHAADAADAKGLRLEIVRIRIAHARRLHQLAGIREGEDQDARHP